MSVIPPLFKTTQRDFAKHLRCAGLFFLFCFQFCCYFVCFQLVGFFVVSVFFLRDTCLMLWLSNIQNNGPGQGKNAKTTFPPTDPEAEPT